jgi:lipoate-protein ligase A
MNDETSGAISVLPYDLADADFLIFTDVVAKCLVWVPQGTVVVLGRGSKVELELNTANIAADRIPVLQRASGGCAVVLTPEMMCVSFGLRAERQRLSSDYFAFFLALIIRGFESLAVRGLAQRGISDLAFGDRKVGGTALYRNRERIYFHAVLNLTSATDLMERYLAHPPRTPDYRENRSHKDFVTSFSAQGYSLTFQDLRIAIEQEFRMHVQDILA